MIEKLLELAEAGKLPDPLIRVGIRELCRQRLQEEFVKDPEVQQQRYQNLIDELRQSPIAIETDAANEQHYEVPTEFYQKALGKNLKYSGCYYPAGCDKLDEAEDAMLALYLQRGELSDGMSILELGCGWGSLTLWMARHLPNAKITGVSNSTSQREHILKQCTESGLDNVEIITRDVNELTSDQLGKQFDRVVSVEMFEHMRNYQTLLSNIASWLKKDGKLFVHIFCHRYIQYPFEVRGKDDWMSQYFFTGGLMPSSDTLLHFQDDLKLEQRWHIDGCHYENTANHWLDNTDRYRSDILNLFADTYGPDKAELWLQRWRIFFMACAELFGYRNGSEWLVAHYLFAKR
ncbi:MAG: SAM-dependent methyltransferase [Arenicella sp.]